MGNKYIWTKENQQNITKSSFKEQTQKYLKSHDRELNSHVLGVERINVKQGHTESQNFIDISEFNSTILIVSL